MGSGMGLGIGVRDKVRDRVGSGSGSGLEGALFLRVELGHLLEGGGRRAVDLHLLVQAVIEQQVVRHPNPVRLHRVPLPIVVVADVAVVEVTCDPRWGVSAETSHPRVARAVRVADGVGRVSTTYKPLTCRPALHGRLTARLTARRRRGSSSYT
jgi:hypothetical protein